MRTHRLHPTGGQRRLRSRRPRPRSTKPTKRPSDTCQTTATPFTSATPCESAGANKTKMQDCGRPSMVTRGTICPWDPTLPIREALKKALKRTVHCRRCCGRCTCSIHANFGERHMYYDECLRLRMTPQCLCANKGSMPVSRGLLPLLVCLCYTSVVVLRRLYDGFHL